MNTLYPYSKHGILRENIFVIIKKEERKGGKGRKGKEEGPRGRGRGTVAESSNSKRGLGVGEEVLGSIPG